MQGIKLNVQAPKPKFTDLLAYYDDVLVFKASPAAAQEFCITMGSSELLPNSCLRLELWKDGVISGEVKFRGVGITSILSSQKSYKIYKGVNGGNAMVGLSRVVDGGQQILKINSAVALPDTIYAESELSEVYCRVLVNGRAFFTSSRQEDKVNPIFDDKDKVAIPHYELANATLRVEVWGRKYKSVPGCAPEGFLELSAQQFMQLSSNNTDFQLFEPQNAGSLLISATVVNLTQPKKWQADATASEKAAAIEAQPQAEAAAAETKPATAEAQRQAKSIAEAQPVKQSTKAGLASAAKAEAGVEVEAEKKSETAAAAAEAAVVEVKAETETKAEAAVEAEVGAEAEAEPKAEVEVQVEAEPKAEAEFEIEVEAKVDHRESESAAGFFEDDNDEDDGDEGDRDENIAKSLAQAQELLLQGKDIEAVELYRDAMKTRHARQGRSWLKEGRRLLREGKFSEATEALQLYKDTTMVRHALHREAKLRAALQGMEHGVKEEIVEVYKALGDGPAPAAAEHFDRWVISVAKSMGIDGSSNNSNTDSDRMLSELVTLLIDHFNERELAYQLLAQVILPWRMARLGVCHENVLRVLFDMHRVRVMQGQLVEAALLLRKSLAISSQCYGDCHVNTVDLRASLAHVLRRRGSRTQQEAVEQYSKASASYQQLAASELDRVVQVSAAAKSKTEHKRKENVSSTAKEEERQRHVQQNAISLVVSAVDMRVCVARCQRSIGQYEAALHSLYSVYRLWHSLPLQLSATTAVRWRCPTIFQAFYTITHLPLDAEAWSSMGEVDKAKVVKQGAKLVQEWIQLVQQQQKEEQEGAEHCRGQKELEQEFVALQRFVAKSLDTPLTSETLTKIAIQCHRRHRRPKKQSAKGMDGVAMKRRLSRVLPAWALQSPAPSPSVTSYRFNCT